MQSGEENIQILDDAEEADRGDTSILPNEEEGDAEGRDASESCAVENPLGGSQGEMKVDAAKEKAVTHPHNDATYSRGTLQNEEGGANSDIPKKQETNESTIQENGERQPSVQLGDGEGEREIITSGENAAEDAPLSDTPLSDAPLSDAPLSDASFSEAFFDQASQFQKAPEDPKGHSQKELADLYREIKKCEDLFLSHFACTGDDSKPAEITSSGEEAKEARKEKKGKVSIPQIDFTSMESISQFLLREDMSDNDDQPIERHLREHVQQLTQEQKKKNKKIKMNKYYLGVRSYLNTLPPSMGQKIFKEYRKNF
ncbi:hypothetical protein C922_03889 [Plasmodium inui San Antonio 1]|uniref:Uncharacterized protein n=1 Tax=Plasmodium inui San Antonio 1 TaxID=1237626 RepID=W7A2S6_9APIC|nr:hypothetical protein C922_03889 [Plasmodium inui San Antonio 1]EUD65643.1 hypothetical protein C922_03889 [Plasmodium inui San Antonio 1]